MSDRWKCLPFVSFIRATTYLDFLSRPCNGLFQPFSIVFVIVGIQTNHPYVWLTYTVNRIEVRTVADREKNKNENDIHLQEYYCTKQIDIFGSLWKYGVCMLRMCYYWATLNETQHNGRNDYTHKHTKRVQLFALSCEFLYNIKQSLNFWVFIDIWQVNCVRTIQRLFNANW